MAISDTDNRDVYLGDGTSASFSFAHEFHDETDVIVYIWNSSRVGTEELLQTLTTDYTISGTKDAQNRYRDGGTVIFNSTPATGDHIVIFRDTAENQPFNLRFNQVIPSPDLIKGMDRISLVEQRQADLLSRSLHLSDGYPLTFNMTLPNQLPKSTPLMINSSATGITTGLVSQVGSTVAGLIGTLPVDNGGTGDNFSGYQGVVYSPAGSSAFNAIVDTDKDNVLISNNSSIPTFDKVSSAHIGSGIIGVSYGGTGTGTGYIQYGVVFASSATQFSNTPAGGTNQPLVGNTGAAPSYQALDISNNSSISGILKQLNGGTGTASSFPLMGVIFQESADTLGFIPSAADGRLLTAHGSSAPSFDSFTPTPVATLTISSDTTLDTTNETIICGGNNYTVRLFDISGADGRKLSFIKTTTDYSNPVTILASSAQTFVNGGTTIALVDKLDQITLISDGTNWHVKNENARMSVAYLKRYEPSGTNGGTYTSGAFRNRSLNTVEGDTSIVSITNSGLGIFELEPGDYEIDATAQLYNVGDNVIRLFSHTQSSTILVGQNIFANTASAGHSSPKVAGRFSVGSTEQFVLQSRADATSATTGLGKSASFADNELYVHARIQKLSRYGVQI